MQLDRPRSGAAPALHTGSRVARLIALVWAGILASALSSLGAVQLDLAQLGMATQTGDLSAANAPARALDGNAGTFSATTEIPNAYWECELSRVYTLTRIEIVAPSDSSYGDALNGLVLRLEDLRDCTVFETPVNDPGPGSTWAADLPAGLDARILRIGLENGQPNGAGKHQVALAEVRAFGDPSVATGPIALGAIATARQSSDFSPSYPASLAIDGDPATFSQTADLTNSFWTLTLDRVRPIQRIEVVNRRDTTPARLAGLVVRILDDQSNTVASTTLTNPGLGGVWGFDPPAGASGRHVRIGLEGGAANGAGDRIVSLAEVIVLTAPNLAQGRDCYMVRYQDNLPPATNANDGNYATETKTTDASVDAYWEVDLGVPHALYHVRAVAAEGFAARLSHATVRLFDAGHDSVFSKHLAGTNPTFDVDVAGPITARYVRVGFENKERSHITGGIEWHLGLREVQVFGRPADEIGLLAFNASTNRIALGDSTTLTWQSEELHRLDLYPGGRSVGAFTDQGGAGQLTVSPANSVEYLLVGTNRNGASVRAVSVIVDDRPLPVRISEFMAENRLSLEDGRGEPSDWIELHNPNNQPCDLAGYGLSDDPATPMKWLFPSVSIPAHGYLVVFASGRNA
ncbi:MAG TPA: discoidin domain-containing protein, partial [Verrucomicrobiota bacterium]|nr:discoidin domain-containing protein [Verrucomicrobiota bacterium]